MSKPNEVYQQTYQNYLRDIQALDLNIRSQKLGLEKTETTLSFLFWIKNIVFQKTDFIIRKIKEFLMNTVLYSANIFFSALKMNLTEMIWFRSEILKIQAPSLYIFQTKLKRKSADFLAAKKKTSSKPGKKWGAIHLI